MSKNAGQAMSYLLAELALKGKVVQEPSRLGFSEQATKPCKDLVSSSVKWETHPCLTELSGWGSWGGQKCCKAEMS